MFTHAVGSKAAHIVSELATGRSRRHLWAHESVEGDPTSRSTGGAESNRGGSKQTEPGCDRVVALRPAIARDNASPNKNGFT
jgi:hypothetical protein